MEFHCGPFFIQGKRRFETLPDQINQGLKPLPTGNLSAPDPAAAYYREP